MSRAPGFLVLVFAATLTAAPTDGWDPAAAARYLDARMDTWWPNAKSLKTAGGDTKCLSCHTAIPYALARPALRKAQGVTALTAHEQQIADVARRRSAPGAVEQPYYDHTEDKKAESAGVEAVLNAVVLTRLDDERSAGQPGAATRAAMARLWSVQRADGAWTWLNFGLEPYEAPDAVFHGATLAAMAAGATAGRAASATDAGRAGVEKLRSYLRANVDSQRLFNRAWLLMAASRLDSVLTTEQTYAIIKELEGRQRPDGGWSLADLGAWRWNATAAPFTPPGQTDAALLAASDGYATGLAVYAIRQSGVASHHPAIRKGQDWLRTHQVPARSADPAWAPWRAHSLNFDREHGGPKGEPWRRMFMSDLATAFAALALL
jgi:hypothetical protein